MATCEHRKSTGCDLQFNEKRNLEKWISLIYEITRPVTEDDLPTAPNFLGPLHLCYQLAFYQIKVLAGQHLMRIRQFFHLFSHAQNIPEPNICKQERVINQICNGFENKETRRNLPKCSSNINAI